ncbi:MAG TPA: YnbE family lipoprotein [Sphingomicrobium sp.]
MTRDWTKTARLALGIAAALPLTGCITVKPPDKPIEVNLNVDIKQEVLVRLQQDVQQMISKNPQAFPPAPTNKKP